jgi:mannosyltransferase
MLSPVSRELAGPLPSLRAARTRLGPRSVPAEIWAVAGLVALAAAIRVVVLANQSFWSDEALTVMEVRSSFPALWHYITHVETSPPLYFVLVWGWAKLFGPGEAALRSLSAVAGISLVPLAYLAARELGSRRAGVLAAALVAVNPFMIWYSQEARAYMLLAALSGAAFVSFARALRRPTATNLWLWAGFSSLAVMTHFFAGFAVAPEALWLLWRYRRRSTRLAVATVAAVQLAMLPFALLDSSHGVGWIAKTPLPQRLSQTVAEWGTSQLFRRTTVFTNLIAGVALVALVAALLWFGRERRAGDRARVAVGIAGFALVVPILLAAVGQDYFIPRNVIVAFLPVVTLVACACTGPAPRLRWAGGALAIALLALFSATAVYVQTHASLQRPQWRDLAASLGSPPVPRAILVAGGTTADSLEIYLPGARWAEPSTRRFRVREIVVVGAHKRFKLLRPPGVTAGPVRVGSAVPSIAAPPGTRLLVRRRVHNWLIARFVLRRPRALSIDGLRALAPEFFRRTPRSLLIFTQRSRS